MSWSSSCEGLCLHVLLLSFFPLCHSQLPNGPPTQAAASISFSDNSSVRGEVWGDIVVHPGQLSASSFEYRVFFATLGSGAVPLAEPLVVGSPRAIFKTLPANSTGADAPFSTPIQGMCHSNKSNPGSKMVPCATPLKIPTGVTHLMVRSHNKFGVLATTGRWIKLVDWTGVKPNASTSLPLKASFADEDDAKVSIGGAVKIKVPFPEDYDIATYRIYWDGKGGKIAPILGNGRLQWAAEVPAVGQSTEAIIKMGTQIPTNAKRLYVVPSNRDGEASDGLVIHIFDHGYGYEKVESIMYLVIWIVCGAFGLVVFVLIVMKLRFVIVRCKTKKLRQQLKKDQTIDEARTDDLKPGLVAMQESPTPITDAAETGGGNSKSLLEDGIAKSQAEDSMSKSQATSKSQGSKIDNNAEDGTTGLRDPEIAFCHQLVPGERVEYWSNTDKTFHPAVVLGRDEHSDVPIQKERRTSITEHSTPAEAARDPVWIKMIFESSIQEDADPERLRLPLQCGESVEALKGGKWLPGRIEGYPRPVQYDVRVTEDSSLLESLPARNVRPRLIVGETVQLLVDEHWVSGSVTEATASKKERPLPRSIMPDQNITVALEDGMELHLSSREVRWGDAHHHHEHKTGMDGEESSLEYAV